ncbi:hypothetical protein [Paenibacillus sp.]|uniref:hypothetical protein n=1 Tax=Paenibacillus sp. TaxID=58172 RepID=UPI00283AB0CF|nr:hypothetical protein [Paenibacillus sp.]
MIIGTVLTNSHLARAKVLAESIKKYNPDVKVIVSLVERHLNPEYSEFKHFDEVVLAKDTWQGNMDFDQILFKYDAWEACCFAKAALFDYIFTKYTQEDHVLFLDSDTEVFSPLDDLSKRFKRSSVLLTPQNIYKGNEYDNFKYGVYNAGMIGATRTPDGLGFVKWWKKRLERHSYFAEYDTLFAEQKWLNLVPTLFDSVEVVKHPGYNIASWNFKERKVTRSDSGKYSVNGEPLYVFHFHAIKNLEKENDWSKEFPQIKSLARKYAEKLDSMGRHSLEHIPWSYNFFTNGTPIDRDSRLVYRNNLLLEKKHPYPFFMKNEDFAWYKENPGSESDPLPGSLPESSPDSSFERRSPKRRTIRARKRLRSRRLNKKLKPSLLSRKRRTPFQLVPLKRSVKTRIVKGRIPVFYLSRMSRTEKMHLAKLFVRFIDHHMTRFERRIQMSGGRDV